MPDAKRNEKKNMTNSFDVGVQWIKLFADMYNVGGRR